MEATCPPYCNVMTTNSILTSLLGCCLQVNRDLPPVRIPGTTFSQKTENTILFTDQQ